MFVVDIQGRRTSVAMFVCVHMHICVYGYMWSPGKNLGCWYSGTAHLVFVLLWCVCLSVLFVLFCCAVFVWFGLVCCVLFHFI